MKHTHRWPCGYILQELADPGAGSSARVAKAPMAEQQVTEDQCLPQISRPGAILKAESWMRLPHLFTHHNFIL